MILEHAAESAKVLLRAFDRTRRARGGAKGATTDEEQDILRSMLVLSAAGLDAITKQLIRDVLPGFAEKDPKVQQGLETFISRKIRADGDDNTASSAAKFMARLLAAKSQREQAVAEYVFDLTGGSLQSPEELMKSAFALGLDPQQCHINPLSLKPIFEIRNKIIHELDINFDAPRRRRHSRARGAMIEYTNHLLDTAEQLLLHVHQKLHNNT